MGALASFEAPGPMVPLRYRVVSTNSETQDTVTLALAPLDEPIAPWTPGQFNMLYSFGVGEVPISFSGGNGDDLHHTIRSVGAVSRSLAQAQHGDVLGVRGPFGRGWGLQPAEGADIVIVAGGIGLAPLRPVATEALGHPERYGRVSLLVGARSPDLVLFSGELDGWKGRTGAHVDVTVDVGTPQWRGRVGLVTDLIPAAPFDPRSTVAFVCGPEVMMRFVAEALVECGLPAERVFISMERNMKCAIGHCGHCQYGPDFVCMDGPIFSYAMLAPRLALREV